MEASSGPELDRAFAAMVRERADALFVLPDLVLSGQATRIAELAMKHRLPAMYWGTWFADSGGLIAYAADYSALSRPGRLLRLPGSSW